MGHYASELDPDWGNFNDHIDRALAVRGKVKSMDSLAAFSGSDFPLLVTLFSSEYTRVTEKELTQLTDRMEKYNATIAEIEKKLNRLSQNVIPLNPMDVKPEP